MNPLTYRGYNYDAQTGLYYLQSRYYSPQWKRFLNADIYTDTDTILGSNMFMYGNNNPLRFVDAEGTFAKKYYEDISYTIAKEYFRYEYAVLIGKGAFEIDEKYPSTKIWNEYFQSWHFNTNMMKGGNLPDTRELRAEEAFNQCMVYVSYARNDKKRGNTASMKRNLNMAFRLFGNALHPMQDTYSHSGQGNSFITTGSYTLNGKRVYTGFYMHGAFADQPWRKYLYTNEKIGDLAKSDTLFVTFVFYHMLCDRYWNLGPEVRK